MSPCPVSGGALCLPKPQAVRLLSCSRDPTTYLFHHRKVGFCLEVRTVSLKSSEKLLSKGFLAVPCCGRALGREPC